jgi:Rps23 Pro-64 3,4-dihydroxylase Tpa1-like proline 4-hydroxylase
LLNQSVLDNTAYISEGLKQPYLVIENALPQKVAEALHGELLATGLWAQQDDKFMSERDGQHVADDFRYSRNGFNLADPRAPATLKQLHQYLNSAPALEWFSAVSGRQCEFFEGVATSFGPGDQITKHNDCHTRKTAAGKTENRTVTFNYWLVNDWQSDFGGRLVWEKPLAKIVPTFNTLLVFLPTQISEHWVEPVTEGVTVPRLTISGWFMNSSTAKPDRLKLNLGE